MINEVLCTELLVRVFSKLKYVYKPCCVLACKHWKEIFDTFDPNKGKNIRLDDVREFLPDMSFPCGMFLLSLVTGCNRPINMYLCNCCEMDLTKCKRRKGNQQVILFKGISF